MVSLPKRVSARLWLVLTLATLASWNLGSAAYIMAKAELAQVLLDRAWLRTVAGGHRERPWPWADTWPVARLSSPKHSQGIIVLEGASGRNLAFGPAHISATPLPGHPGNSVIAGHRDTHFAWLEEVALGDPLTIELTDRQLIYRIASIDIVHESAFGPMDDFETASLILVTCYPFHAIHPGTPLRYIVRAELTDTQPAV